MYKLIINSLKELFVSNIKLKVPGWVTVTVVVGVLVVVGIMLFGSAIGSKNSEVKLRNQFNAQVDANKVTYDEVTKVIFGKAKVSSKYAEDFSKSYEKLMDARYGGKNPMMMWIKEHNPKFDASMYKDINKSIESLRAKFTREQKKLIDLKRRHDDMRTIFPNSIWMNIFGITELDLKIVTSSRVKKSFDSGVDNNANPFEF